MTFMAAKIPEIRVQWLRRCSTYSKLGQSLPGCQYFFQFIIILLDEIDDTEYAPLMNSLLEDGEGAWLSYYMLRTVNSKSFASKVLLRIKWKFKLTVHFKHEMLGE